MIEPHTFTSEQEHNINIVLDVLNCIYIDVAINYLKSTDGVLCFQMSGAGIHASSRIEAKLFCHRGNISYIVKLIGDAFGDAFQRAVSMLMECSFDTIEKESELIKGRKVNRES